MESGTREKLAESAIAKFDIKQDFNKPEQTLHSCIKAKRLEVWHPEFTSPISVVEVARNVYTIGASIINCPLGVSRYIELIHDLIGGTKFKRDMYNSDLEVPSVGKKWWGSFKRRNAEVVSKAGETIARNKADHCHGIAFQNM